MSGVVSWALPLTCTILFYGLAGGFWKLSSLGYGQFCVLFFAIKTLTNWGAWFGNRCPNPLDSHRRRFVRISLLGQLFNGMAWICYFKALSTGPAALVQTITAAYTALTVVLALIFLKERLVAIQVIGVSLVIGSGITLGMSEGGSSQAESNLWLYASFGTLLCWGICTAIFKHAYNQDGADDTVFFLTNWVGMGVTVLPFGISQLNGESWTDGLALGLLIVLLYCLGDLTLFAAINRGPASIVSPLSGLYPLPTIVFSAVVLKEHISGMQWGVVAVVLIALMLIVPAPDNPILKLLGRAPVVVAEPALTEEEKEDNNT
ncbi:MAG: DMT family transporter [Candidatus Eremiobacteraeota bacterium]|nr:DMT family transporter [Candidatus Eremiobacteraeota bacterium]